MTSNINQYNNENLKPVFSLKLQKLYSFFIFLVFFKTAYIAIYSQYAMSISTPIAIFLRILIILIGITIFIITKYKYVNKNFFIILTIFAFSFLVSYFQLNNDLNTYIPESIGVFYLLGIGSFILTFTTVLFTGQKHVNNLEKTFFYSLAFFVILTLLLGSSMVMDRENFDLLYDSGRHQLKSLNPITIGYLGGLLFLHSVWRFFLRKQKNVFIIFVGFLGLLLLFLANSRSPQIGVLVGLIFFFYTNKNRFLFYILSLLLLFSLTSYFLLSYNFDYLRIGIYDGSISTRKDIYLAYFYAIISNPIFPSMHPVMNLLHAHNIFLGVYSASGIIGFILFSYIVYSTLKMTIILIENKTEYGWIGIYFILTFVVSFFSGALLDENFWIVLTLVNIYFRKIDFKKLR
jgi:hypothetical protein